MGIIPVTYTNYFKLSTQQNLTCFVFLKIITLFICQRPSSLVSFHSRAVTDFGISFLVCLHSGCIHLYCILFTSFWHCCGTDCCCYCICHTRYALPGLIPQLCISVISLAFFSISLAEISIFILTLPRLAASQ